MAIQALSSQEINTSLERVPGWAREGSEIVRTFTFPKFENSIQFVNQVAVEAERADHHPDILVQYNKVTLRLSTHDAGGLSERDFVFAGVADRLAGRP
jgi:4a-hydroxytetrahydrobiopterin dehydratase